MQVVVNCELPLLFDLVADWDACLIVVDFQRASLLVPESASGGQAVQVEIVVKTVPNEVLELVRSIGTVRLGAGDGWVFVYPHFELHRGLRVLPPVTQRKAGINLLAGVEFVFVTGRACAPAELVKVVVKRSDFLEKLAREDIEHVALAVGLGLHVLEEEDGLSRGRNQACSD